MLGLMATAACLCWSFLYADAPTGANTGHGQEVTAPDTKYVDAELKTADGTVLHVKVDPTDLQGLKAGSKVEIIGNDDNDDNDDMPVFGR